jgi:ADP-L-glycero-D-manno-heptose 6-epimerase
MRDFLYVKDAVEMTLHFAESATTAGGLFNLGSGAATTWLTLTRAIFSALNLPPQIDFIEMPEALKGKYQYYTKADITKLRTVGYRRAMTPIEDAIRDYVQNHLATNRRLGD